MTSVIADSPTRAPAIRDRDHADHADHDREPEPSRIRVLLEALAYAGAFIDRPGAGRPTLGLASGRRRTAVAAGEEPHRIPGPMPKPACRP